jgi:hypothetical protein
MINTRDVQRVMKFNKVNKFSCFHANVNFWKGIKAHARHEITIDGKIKCFFMLTVKYMAISPFTLNPSAPSTKNDVTITPTDPLNQ